MTVYVTADELLDIEHARLSLRRDQGLAVDRGRLVREAIAIALADLEANGDDSVLVQRLTVEQLTDPRPRGRRRGRGRRSGAAFAVRLDNFEGPFDLLLSLISKHKLDVTEVALSQVTDEFIAHIKAAGDGVGPRADHVVPAGRLDAARPEGGPAAAPGRRRGRGGPRAARGA